MIKILRYKHTTEYFQGRRNSSEPLVEANLVYSRTEVALWQCRELVTVELGQVRDPRKGPNQ